MATTFSTTFRDMILTQGAPDIGYVATNTGDPGTNGANTTTGARQEMTFAATQNQARKGSLITAKVPSGDNVTYYSVWSAATGGDFWFGGDLPTAQTEDFPLTVTLKD